MKMKYGILTFHNIPNYGAAFQALALCKTMRDFGADCEIIDYRCDNIAQRELVFKKSNNPIKTVAKYFLSWRHRAKRIEAFNSFIKLKGIISEITYNKSDISNANEIYDVFISGSDMIWDLGITDKDYTFMLGFTSDNKRRFSYGSSSGKEWGAESDTVMSLLKRYDMIAVRESNIQDVFLAKKMNCKLVVDPTVLVNPDYWVNLSKKSNLTKPKRKYVLVYFAYKGILAAAKKYSKENNLDLIVIKDYKKPFCGYKNLKIYNPEDWLSAFLNSETVFTDSYHGVLFSMMFHKRFFTNNRCNRIESILNVAGLCDRFIDFGVNSSEIDYSIVDERIDAFRNESRKYLLEMINMCQGKIV